MQGYLYGNPAKSKSKSGTRVEEANDVRLAERIIRVHAATQAADFPNQGTSSNFVFSLDLSGINNRDEVSK